MNEHDDDLEPEVEENAEYETAEFPLPDEDEEESEQGAEVVPMPDDGAQDPDDSEV
jgi:hypothetical protein